MTGSGRIRRFVQGGLIFSIPGAVFFALGIAGLAPKEGFQFLWMLFIWGLPWTAVAPVVAAMFNLDPTGSDIAISALTVILSHVNGYLIFGWYLRPLPWIDDVSLSRGQKSILKAATLSLVPIILYAPYQNCWTLSGVRSDFGCKTSPPYGWDFAWTIATGQDVVFNWLLWSLEIALLVALGKYFCHRIRSDGLSDATIPAARP